MVTLNLSPGEHGVALTIARGQAVQAYCSVELILCHWLARLLGTSDDLAGIIFYKVVNTKSRNRILDDLYKRRYGDQYKTYWDSLLKMLRQIDERRNHIVHWHMMGEITLTEDGSKPTGAALKPPNVFAHSKQTPELRLPELMEFIDKCDVFERSLGSLSAVLMGVMPEPQLSTWLEIFQKPVVYPLPDNHPLSRNYKAPGTPPPPSQG